MRGDDIMKVTIDRFEGNYVVCETENRTMMDIAKNKIPDSAKEGDVLEINGTSIIIDEVETELRKNQIEKLTKDLWN